MKSVMIRSLIGCSAATASTIIDYMDWISYASLLMSLTGIGASASAAVWAYRATILGMTRMGKRAAANAL
ncbi:hypothetical protein ACT7DZ_00435 [Bacillus cereus]|nr:hypothetical protein IIO_06370 [Bacillus cereus VD115]CUB51959.1 hypothetical protein BN2127_JRS10_01479 [Bacillus subtilis]